LALGYPKLRIVFQNDDDRKIISSLCNLPNEKSILIPGSGVDLTEYAYQPEPETKIKVIFVGRLLKDKGIREFIRAASMLDEQGVEAHFLAAGSTDTGNPATIKKEHLEQWRSEGIVEFLGQRNDIAQLLSDSHIVVLPSYREGLPKSLIEAAACGRAVVTTNVPGCRDAIIPNETGLLVPHRNAAKLAYAIKLLIHNQDLRHAMGKAGRRLAEEKFAIHNVVDAHMNLYNELINMYGQK
jgi:glycosyltransferase involved in cell wall biosynthesis